MRGDRFVLNRTAVQTVNLNRAEVLRPDFTVRIRHRIVPGHHNLIGAGRGTGAVIILNGDNPVVIGENRQVIDIVIPTQQLEGQLAGFEVGILHSTDMIEDLLQKRIQSILAVVAEAQPESFVIECISSGAITVQIQIIGERQLTSPVTIGGTFHQNVSRVHGMNGPKVGDLLRQEFGLIINLAVGVLQHNDGFFRIPDITIPSTRGTPNAVNPRLRTGAIATDKPAKEGSDQPPESGHQPGKQA